MRYSPEDKTILDVTCGGRSIWFNKHDPRAIYMDIRELHDERDYDNAGHVTLDIAPDLVADFRDIPFPDKSFSLVVFDPPHIREWNSQKSWLAEKYGTLPDDWQDMIRQGFTECMRVLKDDGVLVFKWSETQIGAQELWKAIGQRPLFGHRSGKKSGTYWAVFMR